MLATAVLVLAVGVGQLADFFDRPCVDWSTRGWERIEEFDAIPSCQSFSRRTVANDAIAVNP